jgi:hypothetical protein
LLVFGTLGAMKYLLIAISISLLIPAVAFAEEASASASASSWASSSSSESYTSSYSSYASSESSASAVATTEDTNTASRGHRAPKGTFNHHSSAPVANRSTNVQGAQTTQATQASESTGQAQTDGSQLSLPASLEDIGTSSQTIQKQNTNVLKTLILVVAGLLILLIINIFNLVLTRRIYAINSQVV